MFTQKWTGLIAVGPSNQGCSRSAHWPFASTRSSSFHLPAVRHYDRKTRKPAADSVLLRSKLRLSGADVERAWLLRQYALDRASADAQRLADLQYALAALTEAQDALYSNPAPA
jgi:hypothetical protein